MSGRAGLNRPGYLEAVSCRWCDAHRHGEPVADTQRTETARRRLVVSCGQRSGGSVLVGLGAGGMAGVYQATDQVLDRTVAVKVLGPPYDQDPDFVDQFRHEARMAAGLGHPNVVAIFDSASEGDLHYIVMEYVQGQTLAELLRRHGRLPPGLAAEVAHRVCLALEAAHERGLVHRDIKPANVMVDQAGLVKVMDFGIAKAAAATTTTMLNSAGQLLGTAPYLSPEQAQGRPVDGRSDLYALGCVL